MILLNHFKKFPVDIIRYIVMVVIIIIIIIIIIVIVIIIIVVVIVELLISLRCRLKRAASLTGMCFSAEARAVPRPLASRGFLQ